MKTAIKTTLILTALFLLMNSDKGYSQNSGTQASSKSESTNFYFQGVREEAVQGIAAVTFCILKEGNALLNVVDENGKIVAVLVEGEIYPGEYAVFYKPDSELQAGKYFLRFQMNGECVTDSFRYDVNK
jgi:hypothetical protein